MIVELAHLSDIPISSASKGFSFIGADTNSMANLRGRRNAPLRLMSNYFREMEAGDSSNSNSDESHYQLLLTALATDPPILSLTYRYDIPPSWNKWLLSNHPEVLL